MKYLKIKEYRKYPLLPSLGLKQSLELDVWVSKQEAKKLLKAMKDKKDITIITGKIANNRILEVKIPCH